jgi:DNA-binding transcriptional regulator YiaG
MAAQNGEGRRIRQESGATQAELGEAIGVSAATVHLWETGQRVPREMAEPYWNALESLRREVERQS